MIEMLEPELVAVVRHLLLSRSVAAQKAVQRLCERLRRRDMPPAARNVAERLAEVIDETDLTLLIASQGARRSRWPVDLMYQRGSIGAADKAAAEEILSIAECLQSTGPRAVDYAADKVDVSRSAGAFYRLGDGVLGGERVRRWLDAIASWPEVGGLTAGDVVIRVIVGRVGVRRLARELRVHSNLPAQLVVRSLRLYVSINPPLTPEV